MIADSRFQLNERMPHEKPYYEIFTMEITKIFIVYKTFFFTLEQTVFKISLTKNVSPMKDCSKVQLAIFFFLSSLQPGEAIKW